MESIFQIDNRKVNVFRAGSGTPVLLVHGFPLDHSMWTNQTHALSSEYQVIAPDLRGFGKSAGTSSPVTTMAEFADDLASLIISLNLGNPVTFCGLSMGGYIAWQFFDRHRELLDRLILCDTKASADSNEAKDVRLTTADRVLKEGSDFLADSMVEKLFSPATRAEQPDLVSQTQAVIRSTSAQAIAAAQRGMADRPDMTGMLTSIDIPTLVIVGEEDAITTSREMKSVAEQIPDAQFVEVQRAGHMAPLEQPDQVNSAIRGFLMS